MALKYIRLSQHPGNMSPEQLQAELAGVDDSKLMRSLLLAELEAIRAGEERPIRTMRNLWYTLIKPALSRLGRLNELTSGGKAKAWDKKLSVILGELVKAGETTYEELSIIDGSRQRQEARPVSQPVATVALTGAHYPHIILCSEKDTIYPIIRQVAQLYGVSCYSGGGQPSGAATENLVLEIIRSSAYRRSPQPLLVLSLTDYDPAGYSIANSFFVQVQESLRGQGIRAEHIRLGLLPWQLTQEELLQNAYEPKDKGLEEWLQETGGIGGEPLGLELDALPIDRLRLMFVEEVERQIDLRQREQDLREAVVDLLACELLLPDFEAKRRALLAAARQAGLMEHLQQSPLPEALFKRAALAGMSTIDPVKLELFDTEGIRGLLRDLSENGQEA